MQGKEKDQFALFGEVPISQVVPEDHPLRVIRRIFDEIWAELEPGFEGRYSQVGQPGIPPAVLLRAWLLRALYSIRSERSLCEHIAMNLGFRWFVGLDWEDKVFDATTLAKNRERLFGGGGAEALLGQVVRKAQSQGLMSSDRLVVDGTLIKAWASHKSFRSKDEQEPPQGPGGFKGKKRSNATHESTTDPDARLMRKSGGMEAILCFLGSVVLDPLSGMVQAGHLCQPCGLGENAEVNAALEMAEEHMKPGQILVGDRGYDTTRFTSTLKKIGIRPHPRAKSRNSSLDGRATCKASYQASMKLRHVVEGFFGWLKSSGRLRQTMLRGLDKVAWEFQMYCAAYNLRKMAIKG